MASCGILCILTGRVAGAFQVYSPIRGAVWDSRAAIFCPTEPPKCLEVLSALSCEVASPDGQKGMVQRSTKMSSSAVRVSLCIVYHNVLYIFLIVS